MFLKSTDDSMLDTLQKMSGTTHRTYKDSKTITKDMEKLFLKNEGKVSYNMTTREEPVIKYNDMAFIAERNSILFRAGDSPIWNRNETILPMSWRLFQNTIVNPGKEYTPQTIPTLSTAMDFDVRKNQPNFYKMLEKRMDQANVAEEAMEVYKQAYGYSDYDIDKLDPDNYADDVMDVINRYLQDSKGDDEYILEDDEESWADYGEYEENTEQLEATAEAQAKYAMRTAKKYAGGMLAAEDLIPVSGALDQAIIKAYLEVRGDMEQDTNYFWTRNDGNLYSADGSTLYIEQLNESSTLRDLNEQAKDENSRVFSEEDVKPEDLKGFGTFKVHEAFYRFLSEQDSWRNIAQGRFETAMARLMQG